jgi:hypothetical protein
VEKAFVIRWNVVGIAGGGAFFLSLLLGALSGSPFLSILLKAVIFGIVFALLGGGSAFLLERLVPQLTGGGADADEAQLRNVKKEGRVNIVINDENPLNEPDIEELSLDDPERAEGSESPAGKTSARREDAVAGEVALERGSDGLDDDSADESMGALESEDASGDLVDSLEGGEGDAQESMNERPEATQPRRTAAGMKGKDAGLVDNKPESGDLDVLPDMSSFESSFSPVTSGGTVSDSDSFESFGTDSLKRGNLNQDPDTYVKAVRTILKRDEGKNK